MAKGKESKKTASAKKVDVSKLPPHQRRAHEASQAAAAASAGK
jgi:hypothetical protein